MSPQIPTSPKKLRGRRWVLVLVCGLVGLALGISVLVYASVVVAHGTFPAQFSDFETPAMFFLGYGFGCISITPIVRELEQKPLTRKINNKVRI